MVDILSVRGLFIVGMCDVFVFFGTRRVFANSLGGGGILFKR